jgi:hypothetical protein
VPKLTALGLSVLLATAVHVDWHFARPTHHRLSLGWPYHWALTALVFGLVAWMIGRRWPESRWHLGLAVFVGAVVLGQLIEPAAEVALDYHRLGYPAEPERWIAFAQTMAAAVPTYLAGIWLSGRPASMRLSSRGDR